MRRFLLATLIALGLFSLLSTSLNPKAMALSQQNQTTATVTIPGTQPWTDTGIDLTQGTTLSISASGVIDVANGNLPFGPNGNPNCSAGTGWPGPGLHCFSLIGSIGNNGTPFEVGTSTSFSITTSGRLFLGVNDNVFSDNSGSWSATITVTTSKYIEKNNLTWGGYITSFTNPQNTPISVSGAWTVPSVTCTRNGKPITGYFYVWDGLGGYPDPSRYLEQIGTTSQCNNGKAIYWAWYELVPSQPHPVPITNGANYPVSAGDAMRADVTEQGSGYFVLRIFDDTKGTAWGGTGVYTKIWIDHSSNAIPQTGEWIVEHAANGSLPFPKFNHDIVFTKCYWVQNGPQQPLNTGSNLIRATIYTVGPGNPPSPVLPPKELTNDVQQDGTDFSVHWHTY